MQAVGMVHIVHRLHRLLDKRRRTPAPRLEIGKDMHIADMHRRCCGELAMSLRPRALRLVSGERFARIFAHRVDVPVVGQCLAQHPRSVGVVGTQDDWRFVGSAGCLQSVLYSWNDGFVHPFYVVFYTRHRLAQAYEEAHIGIILDECRDALACVVGNERRDWPVAVLCLYAVMVGKGFRYDDIIEHLYHSDAAFLCFCGQKGEHLLVLLHRGIVHLGGEWIVLQLDKRGKGVSVP